MPINTFYPSPTDGPLDPRMAYAQAAVSRSRGDFDSLRQLSPLPDTELNYIDDVIYETGPDQLNFMAALLSTPELVIDLPNWWGIPGYEYSAVSDHGEAKVSEEPDVRGERHAPDYTPHVVPIPIVWDDMSFGIRRMEASRRAGAPLDDNFARQAVRNINRKHEKIGVRGLGFNIRGNTIPGAATNAINTFDLAGGKPWTDPTKTGDEMLTDVRTAAGMLIDDGKYGPIRVWVSPQSYNATNRDYKTLGSDTILQRINQLQYGNRPITLSQTQELTDEEVMAIEWDRQTIGVLDGTGPKLITWTDGPGFVVYGVMISCIVPLIRFDHNGKTGVAIGTP
jgi:hypothetical protein